MGSNYVQNINQNYCFHENNKQRYPIFEKDNCPIKDCCAMVIKFNNVDYLPLDQHDDNEGFYVVSGSGEMLIDDKEYQLQPGSAMFVPAGVMHSIKRVGGEPIEIFIYHFPVS